MLNDKRIKSCLSRFDSGAYSRLQFLRAVSHSVGAHTESLQPRVDNSNSSEDEDEDRHAGARDSGDNFRASESATAKAASTTAANCVSWRHVLASLMPCGHSWFCETCAMRVSVMDGVCPVSRVDIILPW